MNMKQSKCVQAYKALLKIMNQDTSLPTARKVFELSRKLQPAWEFQLNEERKIFERHPDIDPSNGSVTYETGNKEQEEKMLNELNDFDKEMKELGDMEQTIEAEPFVIFEEENIKIAGKDIQSLEDLITFE